MITVNSSTSYKIYLFGEKYFPFASSSVFSSTFKFSKGNAHTSNLHEINSFFFVSKEPTWPMTCSKFIQNIDLYKLSFRVFTDFFFFFFFFFFLEL